MPGQKTIEFQGDDYIYRGRGPKATGDGPGWNMRRDLIARCIDCGGFITLDPKTDEACACQKLSKDTGFGRFGSRLGDEAIEIYARVD